MTNQPESSVMTTHEAAAYLRCHYSTIIRLLKRKEIAAFRVGADWRLTREAIDAWIAKQEQAGSAR